VPPPEYPLIATCLGSHRADHVDTDRIDAAAGVDGA
jgi:hypothetical protein